MPAVDTPNNATTNIHKVLQKMQSSLDRIEKGGQTPVSKANYAATAAQGQRVTITSNKRNPISSNGDILKERRKAKEMTVRIEDPREVVEIKGKSSKDILQAAQSVRVKVTGIRQLSNGDIRFHTRLQDARNTLQANIKWTKVVAALAKVQQQTFTVIVHGIQVANINTTNQGRAIANLKKANKRLHQNLDIVRISWPMKAMRLRKAWSSLYIEVTTPEMANRLIAEGLINDYGNKECKMFSKDCQITQCFNCHQYGHVRKTCQNQTWCRHCASVYLLHACPVAGFAKCCKCTICGKKHKAWSADCKIRQAQKRQVQAAYKVRPRFYTIISRQNTLEPKQQIISGCNMGITPGPTDTVMKDNIPDNSAMQLFQEITRPLTLPTAPTTPKISTRRSRSASPTTQDLSVSFDCIQPKVKDWKDTIMNPENHLLHKKAYAKPARGRPKKIILASMDDSTASQNEKTL